MKVIVAGLPKTGTKSMHRALEMLGYSVYDYTENTILLSAEYERIVNQGWKIEDFRRMYENVDAAMDIPICVFWEEISNAFPDAKVVLTVRNDEEVWSESYINQLKVLERSVFYRCSLLLSPTFARQHQWIENLFRSYTGIFASPTTFRKSQYNKCFLKKMYKMHNAYVMEKAPKGKILVYNCVEGWEPLCKFLGAPIPDVPFPHMNKKGEFMNEREDYPVFRRIEKEIAITSFVLLTTTTLTGVCLWRYGIPRINFVQWATSIRDFFQTS